MARRRLVLTWPSQLRSLPAPVVRIIAILALANALIWAAVAVPLLRAVPGLATPALLSYTLGLRHGLDADHIAAIDLATRRLVFMASSSGAKSAPVSVGTWFSLGHSTVVVVTCVVVAATSGALRDRFGDFEYVGGIIGAAVSVLFLGVLCGGNGWVLWGLVGRLRGVLGEEEEGMTTTTRSEDEAMAAVMGGQLEGGGVMARVFGRLFRIVDRPWKMYPLGLLFGLGFDTSSEIAVLGIASIQGAQGTSLWVILIFPVLFTAGMCLVDTTDGALMMALYTAKTFSRDHVALLYYSVVLTAITIAVSAFILVVQVLSLVQRVLQPPEGSSAFWDGFSAIGDHFDVVGGCVCGVFLVVGVGSAVVYGPWRRRMERRRRRRGGGGDGEAVVAVVEGEGTTLTDMAQPSDEPRVEGSNSAGIIEAAALPAKGGAPVAVSDDRK